MRCTGGTGYQGKMRRGRYVHVNDTAKLIHALGLQNIGYRKLYM